MRGWAIRILLLLGALLLLSIVGRNAVVQIANQNGSTIPVALRPDDSAQLLLRSRLLQVDLLKADVDRAKADAAGRAATRLDALDYRPFLVAGLIARKNTELRRSASLLEAARRRQPRNFDIRRLLMEIYLLDGRYEDAAREILASIRISATDSKPLLQALAYLSQDSTARQALIRTLTTRADWRTQFATSDAVIEIAPDMVFEIATNSATTAAERKAIVRALSDGRKTALAYRLWTVTPPYPAFRKGEFPIDPGFDGLAQNSGFGWKLLNSGEGVAELVEDRAGAKGRLLDTEYFGGGAALLVEQPMLLAPGSYRLALKGRHLDGQDEAGQYRWTINCSDIKDPIAVLRVSSKETAAFNLYEDFTVPSSGCAVQTLRMTIIPGELDRSMRANFSNIGITRQ